MFSKTLGTHTKSLSKLLNLLKINELNEKSFCKLTFLMVQKRQMKHYLNIDIFGKFTD